MRSDFRRSGSTQAPNEVPAKLLDILKIGTLEAGVGYEDRTAVGWKNSLESLQEPLLDKAIAEQLLRMGFQIDRNGTSANRNRGEEHIELIALGPIEEHDRPLADSKDDLSKGGEVLVPVHPHAWVGKQPIHPLDGVLGKCGAVYRSTN
jgi:hypothetical protein